MSRVLLVSGPPMNLNGAHISNIYCTICVKGIEKKVFSELCKRGISYKFIQPNSEDEIILWLKKQRDADFLLLNPGALPKTRFCVT